MFPGAGIEHVSRKHDVLREQWLFGSKGVVLELLHISLHSVVRSSSRLSSLSRTRDTMQLGHVRRERTLVQCRESKK
jgi:hypothetical protein